MAMRANDSVPRAKMLASEGEMAARRKSRRRRQWARGRRAAVNEEVEVEESGEA